MKKKQRCLLNRFAAFVAALMSTLSLCIPAFAAGPFAAMPSRQDFFDHPFSWYVLRQYDDIDGRTTYELINDSIPLSSSGYATSGVVYNVGAPNQLEFSGFSNASDYFNYAFPDLIEPLGACGSWRYYPDFPVTSYFAFGARVRCYIASISPLYSLADSGKIAASIAPSPEIYCLSNSVDNGTTLSIGTPSVSFSQFIYPAVRGPYRRGNTYATNWVAFSGLNNGALVTESHLDSLLSAYYTPVVTGSYYDLGTDGWQKSEQRFSEPYSFSSSDVRFWLLNLDSPLSAPGILFLNFSLVVPKSLLPSDVQPGDWISQGTMDKLQDQLLNDFDVNSDTLTNSKDNLNSWSSASSVDSDVASGAFGLLSGLFQNLGSFLFSVSLLCFGAVVLRMFIRKAVDG